MAQIETWYRQDLKQPVQVHHLPGNVFSQDNQGNLLGVEVYDDGVPASLSGTVSANIVRSDGGTVAATGTVSGNKLSVVLPAAAYAVPGIISVVLKLIAGGITVSLLAVVAVVYASSTDSPVDPGTIIPSIQDLIDAINDAVASIPQDYSDLQKTSAEVDSTANLLRVDGEFWRVDGNNKLDTGTYSQISLFEKIRCTYGNVFRIQTTGLGTAPSYIITDGELNVLSQGSAGRFDGILEITQQTAYYLCINCANSDVPYIGLYQENINSQKDIKNKILKIEDFNELSFIPSKNIVNLSNIDHEVGYYNDDGSYQSSANYRHYTIPVEPLTTYRISSFRHYLTFWDYAFNCFTASSIGTGGAITQNILIITPADCRYIRVTFAETTDASLYDNFVLGEGSDPLDERLSPAPTLSPGVQIDGFTGIINDNVYSPVINLSIGGVIDDTTGVIEYSSSENLGASPVYYPMIDGGKYIFWGDDTRYNVYFYDKDKNFIEALAPNSETKTEQTIFTNSDGYAFLRIGAYRYGGIADHVNDVHFTVNMEAKKVVCLGDSMTAGNGAAIAYHMYLARENGWTCQNWGVGGAGWAWNMTGSTTVGNGVEGIAPSGVTPSYDTNFSDAVAELPTDGDLYIVFGGYNDWNTDQPEVTFENAVDETLSYLQNNMPAGRVLVITPLQRYIPDGKDGRTANGAGLTLLDYCGIIERISKVHGIRCVNLYNDSGLYPYSQANRGTYYDSDGLHPNANGQKMIFRRIATICDDLCK